MSEQEQNSEIKFEFNQDHTFQPSFEQNSSWFSRAFFVWTHKLIKVGNSKHLEINDLSDLREDEEPVYSSERFSNIFYSLNPEEPSKLMSSFKKHLGFNFLMAGVLATISNLLQFSGPIAIGKVLEVLNNDNPDSGTGQGIFYVSILVICYLIRTIIFQHSMHFINLSCVQVLNSANSLIYNKIIKLSSSARKYLDAGTIMNNVNVDVMAFYFFITLSTFLFSAPFMIITAIVMLILEVGWIGLATPLLFFLGMGLQQKLMKKGFELRKDQLFWSDKRSKCVNEYFSGIRIIKYYGWEKLVADKVEKIRTEELSLNFKVLMIRTYVEVLMNMMPILASIIIFAVYVSVEGEEKLNAAMVYKILSIFNLISNPMRLLMISLITYMNGKASLDRVEHFLGYEEKSHEGINFNDEELEVGEICMHDCKFDWETESAKKHNEKGKKLYENKKPAHKKTHKDEDKNKKKSANKKKSNNPENKKKKKSNKKKSVKNELSLNDPLLGSSTEENCINRNALVVDNFKVQKGEFISIIGRVGSGKSTFISAILGEIDKVEGQIKRRGKISYIPQSSWLRSTTIRENILFETEYNEKRYEEILKICELNEDLGILGGGDLAEIGEKGVNLSGGQKQRISIARAIYTDADIYLIDDCLSALDPYVAKKIFENVIKDYLHKNGKTIIFVTNAIDYTDESERVVVINQGRIVEDGPPQNLLSSESSFYSELKLKYKQSKDEEEHEKEIIEEKEQKRKESEEENIDLFENEENKDVKATNKNKNEFKGLIKVEERLKGSVPWSFYVRFFTGPGKIATFFMFFFILLAQSSRILSDWWLGEWSSNASNGWNLSGSTYIWIYSVISILVGSLLYLKGIFFAKFIIKTSQVIQRQLMKALLKSPLSWFDVTPTGRILARSTKDQDDLDSTLTFNVQSAVQNLFVVLSSIILISVATPFYLIVAFISGIIYFKLVSMYMNASREIKRIEANSRAPLISHFQETITGIYVIRAFQKEQNFLEKFFKRQKNYIVSLTNQNTTSRWISLMTDICSVVTIASAGYFGILSHSMGSSTSSLIGLALVWALQVNTVLSITLRMMADTESNMNAVVRLYDYIDNNPEERDFDEPKPETEVWPSHGVFEIKDISYKYRTELPLVLKKVSFDIRENAKIGIVGRTGSGKSTMTLGLLRILEICENIDGTKGFINLDSENISRLGLHHLRHNVTIIPQDPVLFTGSIKTNLDPNDQYTDEELEECLKKVGLWDQIKENLEEQSERRRKIYSGIDEGGSNFSLGQRQMLCMARALVRKPKVLLMDEATASIDEKTDELIQSMIRKEFTNTTVITIAHRLNTIIQYDKILVLNQGEVQEYDTPLSLVKNESSFLGKMIRKIGKNYLEKMMEMAERKVEE